MVVVAVLVAVTVVALLAGVHWYVWRRLVRDTTRPRGLARRAGTVAVCVLPLLSVGALVSGRAGAPFWLEQVLAWPGYLWLAVLLYLTLALLLGEAIRPLLHRVLRAREARGAAVSGGPAGADRTAAPAASGDLRDTVRQASFAGGGASAADGPPPAAPAGSAADEAHGGAPDTSGTPGPEAAAAAAGSGAQPVPESRSRAGGGESVAATAGSAAAVAAVPGGAGAKATSCTAGDSGEQPAAEASAGGGVPAGDGEPAPRPADRGGGGVSRRVFVSRIIGGGAVAASLGTVGYGTYGVLRGPRVKRVTVPLGKLPRSAQGFRIAVVSDIHLGPVLGRAHTQRIVDAVNAVSPDLIAIVGDLVDGSVADLGPAAEPLARLESRHGAFFVTGNHEYFSGADQWVDHVRELGIRPLQNERAEIAGFDLAGVNDIAGESEGEGPDFAKALGDRDPARASVLLAHQPVVIHDAVEHGVDLQLSGHTHGGQLWPGNYLAELANPTLAGLERYGDTQLYVTRGAGAWGPPVRVGASSDITVVSLAARQA
ncbi:metallophosphoesterase [Streptomyces sp. HNM0663]|uniref:Metallophosphoesterase n=1 Tax=Streptomyces chengmaiensis TaxID=3040919 RepID=A0ABT6HSY1_9ACTN|nr:metallophosphoesterase [Streptomyces chengmaiensis]MDH2391823.1 metallophosphoesterase [Streptomyces chengmaiensis]